MARSGDFYELLGVAKDASPQDIKKAFRNRARECHPDVAGSDPAKADEFKRLREAYEVLSDPAQRTRYDRRGQPRTGGPFFGNMWNRGNVNVGAQPSAATRAAGNDLDLEDIFNDFSGVGDFGFTGQTRGQPSSSQARPHRAPQRPGHRPAGATHGVREEAPRGPQPGRDIPITADIPADVASRGGTVTVSYSRLRRADDGHTLYRYDELHDLKVPPHTRHGTTLRVEKMGDAGLEGGIYGDLVVDVRVSGRPEPRGGAWDPEVEGKAQEAPPTEDRGASGRMRMPGHEAPTTPDGALRVDISVVQALLGGRVSVVTPTGTVRVNVPAGTSSGTRMRLRGKGPAAADGTPTDLVAELRIVVPKHLDEESQALIRRFGELNPEE